MTIGIPKNLFTRLVKVHKHPIGWDIISNFASLRLCVRYSVVWKIEMRNLGSTFNFQLFNFQLKEENTRQ